MAEHWKGDNRRTDSRYNILETRCWERLRTGLFYSLVVDLTQLLVKRRCNTKATARELSVSMDAGEFVDMPTNNPEFMQHISKLHHS